jgi:cysteine desulfurase/selenocysteine lyase
MNTSDLGPGSPVPSAVGGSDQEVGQSLAGELARLANQLFTGFPGPTAVAPSAAQVGAGGASPAVVAPPVPGTVQQFPPASAPLPPESQLRPMPGALAGNLGIGSPVSFAKLQDPTASHEPYFLEHARLAPANPKPNDASLVSPLATPTYGSLPSSTSIPFAGAGYPTGSYFEAPVPGISPSSAPGGFAGAPGGLPGASGDISPSAFGIPGIADLPASPGAGSVQVPSSVAAAPGYSPGFGGLPKPAGVPVADAGYPTVSLPDSPVPGTPSALPGGLPSAAIPAGIPNQGGISPSTASVPHLSDVPSPGAGLAGASAGTASSATGLSIYDFRPELTPDVAKSTGIFDPNAARRDFPILRERVHGRPLIWLDNGATTQKPNAVIDRLSYYYEHENSNIHRGAHTLAARSTDAYEGARDKVRRFLNAPSAKDIVFVRGGTEAINLVAQSWGRKNIGPDDEIVITHLEHHANIVPWQQLSKEKGSKLRVAPVDDRGQVLLEDFERLLSRKTRLVAITHVSNALGTIVPVKQMIEMAHRHGAVVLVDGAQAVAHMPVDVQALDCDFYCFSGHKVYAPTGIGALYGRGSLLEQMPPWQGGGNMIADVTFERTVYQPPPWRFEAGTGNIADAVGLGAAIDYVTAFGMPNLERYEHELLGYATEKIVRVPGLRLLGTAADKAGVLSFTLDGHKSEDVGSALDQEGIAVRAGHHCAQPILRRFGVETSVRATLALYNTCEDVDALVTALNRLQANRRAF